MNLRQLSTLIDGQLSGLDSEVVIDDVVHDSRQARPGALFVALPGRSVDGATFLPQAIERGVSAVALPLASDVEVGVPTLRLPSPRADMATLAAAVHGEPAQSMLMVGVTGTNGKTTVSTLIAEVCTEAGVKEGLIGTIESRIAGQVAPANFTTPESTDLHRMLAEMLRKDVEIVVMEVSSIGLEESRVEAVPFKVAGFLNLSADHLDYHGDMDAYGSAKSVLFTRCLSQGGTAIIDIDDRFGAGLAQRLRRERTDVNLWTLSLADSGADVHFSDLQIDQQGIHGRLLTPQGALQIDSPLLGSFNASNLAMAAALSVASGLDQGAVTRALSRAQVRGRLERVEAGSGVSIVVDYAHSVDAIERVIRTLKSFAEGDVWCVIGCGGDRDRTKRAPMGRAAALADGLVITSDNPRTEDPKMIADEAASGAIAAGLSPTSGPSVGGVFVELDRRAAISAALSAAQAGDVVLVAGKGHETYQEIMGVRYPFDDVTVIRELLEAAS